MAIIGRLVRLEKIIRPRLNAVFAQHDLDSWEFDVLATLVRSITPPTNSPSLTNDRPSSSATSGSRPCCVSRGDTEQGREDGNRCSEGSVERFDQRSALAPVREPPRAEHEQEAAGEDLPESGQAVHAGGQRNGVTKRFTDGGEELDGHG